MKKILLSAFLVFLLVSASLAQVFIGSRQAGMGGTGVASAVGLNAVAFNPAGLMKGPKGEFLVSLGFANQGVDQLIQSFSSASDPAQFMTDSYGTNLNANGSLYGILGFNFRNIGVSLVVPSIMASLSKPAASLAGSVNALATTALVVTAGHTFATPALPFASVDVGANAKAITAGYGNLTIAGTPVPGSPVTATQTVAQASGSGFDLGARATVDVPMLVDFSVGIALRDLAQSIKYKPTTRTDTYSVVNPGDDPTLTKGSDVEGAEVTANYPSTTAIGCAGTVKAIGLKVAADISSVSGGSGILAASSETLTSIGVEYPLLMRTLILRGGIASSANVSRTTLGAKINIPFLTLEIANIIDNKNSANTSYVLDAGLAF
jgi:hypothetical protein